MQASKLNKAQLVSVLKAAAYVGVSAVLAQLITATTNTPDLFGPFTFLINTVLVLVKKVFTPVV